MRRRLAGLLNERLMPRLGVKLVRSRPKTIRYKRLGSGAGTMRVRVTGERGQANIRLREGTSDWMTFDQVFVDEDYDLRSLPRYGDVVRAYRAIRASGKAPLIVDLGANIGLSALYFSLTWPDARIVAVEPDAENFALLSANVAQSPSIEPRCAAAASSTGSLAILDPGADKNAVRTATAASGKGPTVDAVPVSAIVQARAGDCAPFIAKIDIEGAEAELFSANLEWIDAFPLIVIELHDWLYPGERTSRNFLKAISERDRDFVYLDENIFSIRNERSGAQGNR